MVNVFDPQTERFVSEKHQYVASIVQDYNPDLQVVWIPPENRHTDEDRKYPFAIMHMPKDREPYIVMLIKENEMDQRVLERLFLADQTKVDVGARLEAANRASKLLSAYEEAARMEELTDFHASLIKSPKHTYRHNGKVYHQ